MRNRRVTTLVTGLAAMSLLGAACGGSDAASPAASGDAPVASAGEAAPAAAECTTPDKIKLQLQWVTQSQFAGYFAALDQGFYKANCLEVTVIDGAVEITPQTELANGAVDFAISWVPKALASREAGADIVNIAQVYQRSGTLQVSLKSSGITGIKDLKGKKVGNWGFGNEFEVFAGLTAAGLDPSKDVTNVQQSFDMVGLLAGDIDAAEAMTYNEYAQVLETINPDSGKLYTADDLNVISYEDEGVGMLQDAIWADGKKLASDPAYKDIATRFVAGSLEGWAYCRDNVQSCADIVVKRGAPFGGPNHQLWMMNEVNKLIWPAAGGAGMTDQAAWDRTVKIAMETKNIEGATVLTKAPDAGAYTNDIVKAALAMLDAKGVDTKGADFKPTTVVNTEGGV
jgi:NitT/TauT family transport system substrate-binding protein